MLSELFKFVWILLEDNWSVRTQVSGATALGLAATCPQGKHFGRPCQVLAPSLALSFVLSWAPEGDLVGPIQMTLSFFKDKLSG